jgi:hypothetical protein
MRKMALERRALGTSRLGSRYSGAKAAAISEANRVLPARYSHTPVPLHPGRCIDRLEALTCPATRGPIITTAMTTRDMMPITLEIRAASLIPRRARTQQTRMRLAANTCAKVSWTPPKKPTLQVCSGNHWLWIRRPTQRALKLIPREYPSQYPKAARTPPGTK